MKTNKSIFLLFSILFYITLSCTSAKKTVVRYENALYKVKKIYNRPLYDLIYAEKNDSLYQIISFKDIVDTNNSTIEINKKYHLNLIKLYPNPITHRRADSIWENAIDSITWFVYKKMHYCIYTATNLNGSVLLDNDKSNIEVLSKFRYCEIIYTPPKRQNYWDIYVYFMQ
ncbi:hypothetical protein FACS1894178_7990 [Bacteroidia bacterium]|nr:hypothetical protein FACS1894178_7990 [Bacteroidia bacterium]